jgi:hypothetical protein
MAILVDGFEIVIIGDAEHVVQLNLGGDEIIVSFHRSKWALGASRCRA